MIGLRMFRRSLLLGLGAVLAAYGGGAPLVARPVPLVARPGSLVTVFAAASLTEAMQAVGKAYTARTGVAVRFSFAASSLLARQIENGARADLFVSADQQWMDHVERARLLVAGSRHILLRGRLVLIAPTDARVALLIGPRFALAAALGPSGRLAVGDPDYVPAGLYAKAALTKVGAWQSVQGRLARADNVRIALSYVARHEAPLGIVYETDARAEPGVTIIDVFPENSHPPIDYPVAIVRGATPAARGFAAFLGGAQAKAIFRRFGFRTFG